VESINSPEGELAVQLSSDAPNVAVIAIHGVGHHLSGASADAVSTLLLTIGRGGGGKQPPGVPQPAPPYSGFVTDSIDVPLRPVQSPPDEAAIANDRHQALKCASAWVRTPIIGIGPPRK
jgi:hypothetical protein